MISAEEAGRILFRGAVAAGSLARAASGKMGFGCPHCLPLALAATALLDQIAEAVHHTTDDGQTICPLAAETPLAPIEPKILTGNFGVIEATTVRCPFCIFRVAVIRREGAPWMVVDHHVEIHLRGEDGETRSMKSGCPGSSSILKDDGTPTATKAVTP